MTNNRDKLDMTHWSIMASEFGDVTSNLYLTWRGFSALLIDQFDPEQTCFFSFYMRCLGKHKSPPCFVVQHWKYESMTLFCSYLTLVTSPYCSILWNFSRTFLTKPSQQKPTLIDKQQSGALSSLESPSFYIGGSFTMCQNSHKKSKVQKAWDKPEPTARKAS